MLYKLVATFQTHQISHHCSNKKLELSNSKASLLQPIMITYELIDTKRAQRRHMNRLSNFFHKIPGVDSNFEFAGYQIIKSKLEAPTP